MAHAGKVIGIVDGNTLTMLVDKVPTNVRLAYIDAPEKGQAFAQAAKQSLSELCMGKDATYKEAGESSPAGDVMAIVTCGRTEANKAQVERGMAWAAKNHGSDKQDRQSPLANAEAAARGERKGLWADEKPVPPWEYRRPLRRTKASMASRSDDAICFVDRRGEYRVIDGSRRYGC
ncbi:nuclease [Noviherbaspirillum saxi]|uniref:Nuclease n=2 Tax=Noviherbaspirillum saxi TaxID=2320863 RepID=A0A3A3FNN7_9BURK|nr:nuclease [Noviherbaspirillum saxi]